jgi:hypothetical protein
MPSVNLTSNILSFSNIHWPVWSIRAHESIAGGLVTDAKGVRRLDLLDKSEPFPMRRIKAKHLKDYKLYPLRKPIWNVRDLVTSGSLTFIDYDGKVFNYKKTTFYPLVYKKIISKKYTENSTVFKVEDIHTVFEVKGKLNLEGEYAGILIVNKGYLFYELSKTKKKDTKRKV